MGCGICCDYGKGDEEINNRVLPRQMQGQPNAGVAFCTAPGRRPGQVVGVSGHEQGQAAAQALQLCLALTRAGRSASFPLLQSLGFQCGRRPGWGVNKAEGCRRRGCRKGGLGAKKRLMLKKGEREGGMQRKRRKTALAVGLGLMLGIMLPARTPTILSLAGAHELVRMER